MRLSMMSRVVATGLTGDGASGAGGAACCAQLVTRRSTRLIMKNCRTVFIVDSFQIRLLSAEHYKSEIFHQKTAILPLSLVPYDAANHLCLLAIVSLVRGSDICRLSAGAICCRRTDRHASRNHDICLCGWIK